MLSAQLGSGIPASGAVPLLHIMQAGPIADRPVVVLTPCALTFFDSHAPPRGL